MPVYVNFTEVVVFRLNKEGDKWVITGPQIPPHVSEAAFQRHVEKLEMGQRN